MEYRLLGNSGLKVSALCFGAATFGGGTDFFKAWGSTDVAEATRLVDVCMDAGINLFDTANIYSNGLSEEILGEALKGSADLDEGDFPTGAGSERCGLVAPSPDQGVRGQFTPVGHGLH
jgi:aryl-alcohol dehydrogenase-like predicted oxidoreductase